MDLSAGDLAYIHLNKTAAMLELSFSLGARIGGASEAERVALVRAGRELGLARLWLDVARNERER